MKQKKIYLDTSVVSAFNDTREPEKRQQTREFIQKVTYEAGVYISSLVKDEISVIRNSQRRKELFELMENFESFPITDEARKLAEYYVNNGLIPDTHVEDALHLAVATTQNIDIVVSWNYSHLVNLKTRHLVNALNLVNGYKEIEIILPIEF